MTRTQWLMVLTGCVLLASAGIVAAQQFKQRQYYSSWHKHPSANYHYRFYYFKPHANFVGFKHHYVIHHPQRPGHLYFYNPTTKQYWGRCPTNTNGKPAYSLLAEKDRKATLAEIPESAFPKPGPMPPIPESTDNEPMDLPPDDLPAAEPPK